MESFHLWANLERFRDILGLRLVVLVTILGRSGAILGHPVVTLGLWGSVGAFVITLGLLVLSPWPLAVSWGTFGPCKREVHARSKMYWIKTSQSPPPGHHACTSRASGGFRKASAMEIELFTSTPSKYQTFPNLGGGLFLGTP